MRFTSALPEYIDPDKFSDGIFPEDSVVFLDNVSWVDSDKKSILLLREPDVVSSLRMPTLQNGHRYYKIYTHDEHILEAFPSKAIRWVGAFGATMAEDVRANFKVSDKEFKISTWASSKVFPRCPGHSLRMSIYFNRDPFPDNFVFFRSSEPYPLPHHPALPYLPDILPDPDGKTLFWRTPPTLFEKFQFSVEIENNREKNYFTQKLLDCLAAKTIPIYWGCPNISEFFDTTGWIIFDDVNDLVEKLKVLDDGYYNRHFDTVEKNALTVETYYTDFYKNFERQHKEHLLS